VDQICGISTGWSSTALTLAVAAMCVLWMWKSVAMQVAHALEQKRSQEALDDDYQRAIRLLNHMREMVVVKSQETLRGVEQQRLIDDAACFQEAIRRLQGADVGVKRREAA
jgi:hypothetical protein